MGDIFQEVEEEVRRDRYSKLWKDYGGYIIAAAVALVLGTTASVGWREYTAQRQQDDSDRFVAAAALSAEGKQLKPPKHFVFWPPKRRTATRFSRGFARLMPKESGDIAGAVKWTQSQPMTVSMSSIAIWRLC